MPRYDRCDADWRVLKLVRVGHHIWHLRAKSRSTVERDGPILEALETVWRLKQELKAEIAEEKKRTFAKSSIAMSKMRPTEFVVHETW
jgi:hypothetical protein